MNDKEGRPEAAGQKVAVIVSRFNQNITDRLLQGAREAFARSGGAEEDLTVVKVPGAYELPLAARKLAGGQYDGIVALGAVVRGETPHFDYVCSAASEGLLRVMLDTGVPVGFGVITTDTIAQAMDRAGGKAGNKGAETMLTVLEMASLLRQL
ncbi:MAG: 6,7-dimethyl-8-ribityllumazine synthase [Deltaproteobacteria bacterium]|nr:6,7-dimethyl-8-ribityllumazine synthase [Deltaproteobacteria bacterium]